MQKSSFISLCLLIFISLMGVSCTPSYFGSSYTEFEGFPTNPISVEDAIRKAETYLDKTFELRTAKRERISDTEPVIWVTLKGTYYYIVKDNYPSYTPGFYLRHAVKVNKDTGEVMPPQ